LWAYLVLLASWALISLVGAPISTAISAILLIAGISEIYERLKEIYLPLKDWLVLSYEAKADADFEAPAKAFAEALAKGAIAIFEFVVLHRIFRTLQIFVSKRIPSPAWLEAIWQRTVGKRLGLAPTVALVELEGAKLIAPAAGAALGVLGSPIVPIVALGAGAVAVVTVATVLSRSGKNR
jgi:hypothetical protein